MSEIVNRVAQSQLITFNLEDYYVPGTRSQIDLKQWLYEGFVLREKEFRQALREFDWEQYKGAYVALHCSSDAIVPTWAYMLVATHLKAYAKKIVYGDLEVLESILYAEKLRDIDLSEYQDKPIIVKGCSDKPVPQNAYLLIISKLQEYAKSIMYGEACSAVPLYKKKK
ncbi:hypothetical protein CAP47_08285 [Psychroflexus sp. S27]|uniref:DUF2480 family protein n=1 Tax=Psychroflexus sp. S27 TaxID=1982757 RepID=UPI000C2B22F6|nr:DUF2480 family protein [Psychroflexus sp. S27]PJX21625.1 hypothetical protein CAP47_08285 [Psychroflexus sp. S27]